MFKFEYKEKEYNDDLIPRNAPQPSSTTVQPKLCPAVPDVSVMLDDHQNRIRSSSSNNSKKPIVMSWRNQNVRISSSSDDQSDHEDLSLEKTGFEDISSKQTTYKKWKEIHTNKIAFHEQSAPDRKIIRKANRGNISSSPDKMNRDIFSCTATIGRPNCELTRKTCYCLPESELKHQFPKDDYKYHYADHQSPKSEHQTLHQSPKTGHQMFPQSPKMEHQRRYQFLNREHQTIPSNESETNSISNVKNLDSKEILKRLELMEYKIIQCFTSIVKRLEDIEDRQMNVLKFAEEASNLIVKDKIKVCDVSTQCFIKDESSTFTTVNNHETVAKIELMKKECQKQQKYNNDHAKMHSKSDENSPKASGTETTGAKGSQFTEQNCSKPSLVLDRSLAMNELALKYLPETFAREFVSQNNNHITKKNFSKKKTKPAMEQHKLKQTILSRSLSDEIPSSNHKNNNNGNNYHFYEVVESKDTEVSLDSYSYLKKYGLNRNFNLHVHHKTSDDDEDSEQFEKDEDKNYNDHHFDHVN